MEYKHVYHTIHVGERKFISDRIIIITPEYENNSKWFTVTLAARKRNIGALKRLLDPTKIKLKLSFINEIGERYRDKVTNPNTTFERYETPLFYAVTFGCIDISNLLFEYGAIADQDSIK